jgi:putative PIN family toxin of toxin-antitoxin system
MTKIVIDANIVISAGLKPHSTASRAILLARSYGAIVMSDAVEAEIRAVAARPKFQPYAADLQLIVDVIVAGAERHRPSVAIADCRDTKDNKYLELAFAANAATIISGDNDLLVLNPWRGIEIVTAAGYVRRFS